LYAHRADELVLLLLQPMPPATVNRCRPFTRSSHGVYPAGRRSTVTVRTSSTELRPVLIARLRRRSRRACWRRSAQRSCRPRRAWGS
jgi:hypothetical protein